MVDVHSVVIVNECRIETDPGDVSVYPDMATAAASMEARDVSNGEYYAYHLDGTALKLDVSGDIVVITPELGKAKQRAFVHHLLRHTSDLVSSRRQRPALASDASALEHIENIGFSR